MGSSDAARHSGDADSDLTTEPVGYAGGFSATAAFLQRVLS
jgi:hypothetical protein